MLKVKKVTMRIMQMKQGNRDVYIKFQCPEWNKEFLFQLDGGPHVSIIKKETLPHNVKIFEDELLIITGVDKSSQPKNKTIGYVFLPVKMKNETVDIKFHVIEGDSLDI